MQNVTIRMASVNDAPALAAIYSYYVINSPATFEVTTPSAHEFAARIEQTLQFYPYLVCEVNGQIAGYAYSGRHMARSAYQWNAELSLYLHKDFTGKGLGPLLFDKLIQLSVLQGLHNLYGLVTSPNPASEKLHARFGFTKAGTWQKTGFKNGQWLDVILFEKRIANAVNNPLPPLAIQNIDPAAVASVLSSR
ncbi:N-acetyltransferase family protein [Desulfovibrio sp. OttesenSCG-928-F07]|nr:N-acetyltransferase family protein [Desulfovibrio sp. OttesenSCG-928-F07]